MSGYGPELAQAFVRVADDRRVTLFPRILERIRARRAKNVLDHGGGDGELARLCASAGVAEVMTYDASGEMTALARRACDGMAAVHVIERTTDLADASFDVVTSVGVWMCWGTEEECVASLSEIRRLLTPHGALLAAVTHPCFRDRIFATYRTDFEMTRYLEDGAAFRVTLFDGEREVELADTHWSLTAMSRQLHASGFRMSGVTEIADASGAVGSPWMIVEAEPRG